MTVLHKLTLAALAAGLLTSSGCSTSSGSGAGAPPPIPMHISAEDGGKAVSWSHAQSIVLDYADLYTERVAQVANKIKAKHDDPRIMLEAHRAKAIAGWSMQQFASLPNPYVAFIDMLTISRLHRISIEKRGPRVFGEDAQMLIDAHRQLEKVIWDRAAELMLPENLENVSELIKQWLAQHPDHEIIVAVSLDDFADSRRKSALEDATRSGGLFGIRNVTRAVDMARLFAERAIHTASRMPIVAGWVFEGVILEMLNYPDFRKLLDDSATMAKSTERFATMFEKLPEVMEKERAASVEDLAEKVAAERTAALEQVAALVDKQREAFFTDLMKHDDQISDTAREIRETVEATDSAAKSIGNLLTSMDQTSSAIIETTNAVERLVKRFESDREKDIDEPSGLAEITSMLTEAATAARELNAAVTSTDGLLASRAWESRMEDIDERADHAFWLGIVFTLVACCAGAVTVFLYKIVSRRMR